MVVILLNSIQLALFDYTDRTSESLNNKLLDKVDAVFTAIYAMEAALKIFSYGFFLHKNSYLRDFWNDIDFIVAFTG